MKIAHISDLHLDTLYKKVNYKNTLRLMEFISDNRFDHVIITGDITENAVPSAFELARNIFKKHGLLHPDKLSLTIGNHDIYGGVHLAEEVPAFPKKCRATDYKRKVLEFAYYFREAFDYRRIIRPDESSLFPFIKEFDDFLIIGLNSIAEYSVLKNPFASNGKIRPKQIDVLKRSLEDKFTAHKKRIVITHHHFTKDTIDTSFPGTVWQAIEKQTMKLRNKKRIIKQLKNIETSAVLHGHLHETKEYYRRGIRFFNAGGSVTGGSVTSGSVTSGSLSRADAEGKSNFTGSAVLKFNSLEISPAAIKNSVINIEPVLPRLQPFKLNLQNIRSGTDIYRNELYVN